MHWLLSSLTLFILVLWPVLCLVPCVTCHSAMSNTMFCTMPVSDVELGVISVVRVDVIHDANVSVTSDSEELCVICDAVIVYAQGQCSNLHVRE